jgi:SAM-dependent methyltransferase
MTAPTIFDPALVRRRRRRAAMIGPATFLIERVAGEMAERLASVLRKFEHATDLSPTDHVRQALAGTIDHIVAVEPTDETFRFEAAPSDLVVSALALQTVNDLPGALVQIRRALRPDGLFLAALLGGDTLTELRQSFAAAEAEVEGGVSPRVAPFVDLRDMGSLLQRAKFALPVTDVDRVTVRYATPFALMQELRRMGATNPLVERRRVPLRRATLLRMAELYAQRFSDPDGKVRATFEIVWLSGWAPHESQQKPLAPGSARTRLADVLGVTEQSAGEKTRR